MVLLSAGLRQKASFSTSVQRGAETLEGDQPSN